MFIEVREEELKRLIDYTKFAISEDPGDLTVAEDYDLIEKLEEFLLKGEWI